MWKYWGGRNTYQVYWITHMNTHTHIYIYIYIYCLRSLKFTLKHLKDFYMFRTYDHPPGAHIVPWGWSYVRKIQERCKCFNVNIKLLKLYIYKCIRWFGVCKQSKLQNARRNDKIPEFFGRITKKTRRTIATSTMTQLRFERDTPSDVSSVRLALTNCSVAIKHFRDVKVQSICH